MKILYLLTTIVSLSVLVSGELDYERVRKFLGKFYKTLSTVQNGNKVSSPLAANLALYTICYGSRGRVLQEMSNLLRVRCRDENVKDGYKTLINTLTGSKNAELSITAKIFQSKDTLTKPQYEYEMQEIFKYNVIESVDYRQPTEAIKTINDWIHEIIGDSLRKRITAGYVSSHTSMILVSATHLEASWEREFNPLDSEISDFHSYDGLIYVPYMTTEGKYTNGFSRTLHSNFIQIPYRGREFSMVIFVPISRHSLEDLEKNIEGKDIQSIVRGGTESTVKFYLPKFKIESTFELKPTLQEMGFLETFRRHNDFAEMFVDPNYISLTNVLHKTVITVEEGGTNSEGSTYDSSSNGLITPSFKVNRPFFFVILHEPTGLHAFTGSVYSPML